MSKKNTRKTFHRFISCMLDFFFPPVCVGCEQCLKPFAEEVSIFCTACQADFDKHRMPNAILPKQMPLNGIVGPISLVTYTPKRFDGMPERLIYHIKHKDHVSVFNYVAGEWKPLVCHTLETLGISARQCLVTYPPRRQSAVRKEGFDQAEALAYALADAIEGEAVCLLKRTSRKVTAQKKLNAKQRAESAAVSYVLEEDAQRIARGRVILLVDDLYTTGATLQTCADLLIDAGALLVVLVTVGQTVQHQD